MSETQKLQPALYSRDKWVRGIDYQRTHRIQTRDELPVDFTGWDRLRIALEGSKGTKGQEGLMTVRFAEEEDGVGQGIILVTIPSRLLELDRPKDQTKDNTVRYSIQAISNGGDARPVAQCTLRITDTAFI